MSLTLRREATKQLAALDEKEDSYFDLIGDPDWPQAKLREHRKTVRHQQASLRRQLETQRPTSMQDGP